MISHLFVDSTNIGLFPVEEDREGLKRSQSDDANSEAHSRSILLLITSGPVALPGSRESKTYFTSMSSWSSFTSSCRPGVISFFVLVRMGRECVSLMN